MNRGLALCVTLAASACVAPGMGGMNADMMNQRQGDALQAAEAQAQASAARPGDEAMSCAAIEAEMKVMFNDPAFQASVNSMGSTAQGQMDRANAAKAGAVGLGVGSMAAGIASSFIPGAGWFNMAAMQAQQAAAASQMATANRERQQMMNDTVAIMPQIYRGQRLYELGQAKKCPFATNPGPA